MNKKEDPQPQKLKKCSINPAHIWMADIPYCPYCTTSPDLRAHLMDRGEKTKD
jgi:DNA-binding helix-hairpin-helix protein with protein kinase domain